jgi:hypothetical protein
MDPAVCGDFSVDQGSEEADAATREVMQVGERCQQLTTDN